MNIFNNWDIIPKGWYVTIPSQELVQGKIKSLDICGQRIVLFRGEDSKVKALDAYCPHLGTDLGIGKVDGNLVRCFFHHWAFDETGKCQDIPCQNFIPETAKTRGYATTEKYGFIWVYPELFPDKQLPDFDELKGREIVVSWDKAFTRKCHHHICMMNGIDVQHLQTVHKLDIKMELSVNRNFTTNIIDFTLKGELPFTTWRERMGRFILGEKYEYSMRYVDGCIGMLTIMKNVRFMPPLHMIYAYKPSSDKPPVSWRDRLAIIQPIYVTQKRSGIVGWLVSQILLLLTRLAYYTLKQEDGIIYDNINFNPKTILNIDRPLIQYINYVNELTPSQWSKNTK
ncbi:aromatic ring-hydroxylating oxygenase subunit alpha [Merismopedia glauca]|uniref:Aromatic ring-hydroxylating dioxygenase subunit alpha n=1 Tax=Merismopedia glauca CCAP 1448/3 TaxID=1296344 RepID=A0A2T1C4Z9_9CYAN|nr:aromatic ring-hydroxylating dioxygenase subunit alpha [Merismopedia glauca]PSB03238.1 aromatic ring-hydroxylating dioxygenase subunit alpha [Merismopedia glauca CCAP 1448/3]